MIAVAGSFLAGLVFRHTVEVPSPGGPLPLWAGVYATLVWPVGVGVAEQMSYMGYALPRPDRGRQGYVAEQ